MELHLVITSRTGDYCQPGSFIYDVVHTLLLDFLKIEYQSNPKADKELSMSGKNGDQTRAQVAWETITLPQSKGGLGIIDPIKQSKALLAKLVVQSLLPRDEVWKKLLLNRMAKNSPMIWKPWKRGNALDFQ